MYMKEVTVAEFRRNLKAYLDHMQGGGHVYVRGLTLCTYLEDVHENKENVHKEHVHDVHKEEKMEELKGKFDVRGAKKEVVHVDGPSLDAVYIEKEKCMVCTQNEAVKYAWNEKLGEDMPICEWCVKVNYRGKGSMFKKHFNKLKNITK